MENNASKRVLFGHTPKAAGTHLIEYFRSELQYPVIQSDEKFDNGVWRDFTLDQVRKNADTDHAFLCSHVLAFGWSSLVTLIPYAEKTQIVDTIQKFRSKDWFAFTFVRHPGELLTSFYYYILDAHERGWHDSVALHTPAVGRTLEEFVAEHYEKELIPDYWREYDFANVASDENLRAFFSRHFGHVYEPKSSPRHASGSRGFEHYCKIGEISEVTRTRIENSQNMEIFQEILRAGKSS